MKIILKIVRNGLGYLIAFISWIFIPKKIKRSEKQQQVIDKKTQNLELYQFFGCPFCIKIRRNIRRLNLKIITRDAQSKGKYKDELLTKGGKLQVPCLKIISDKEITWMYDTGAIIIYLNKL